MVGSSSSLSSSSLQPETSLYILVHFNLLLILLSFRGKRKKQRKAAIWLRQRDYLRISHSFKCSSPRHCAVGGFGVWGIGFRVSGLEQVDGSQEVVFGRWLMELGVADFQCAVLLRVQKSSATLSSLLEPRLAWRIFHPRSEIRHAKRGSAPQPVRDWRLTLLHLPLESACETRGIWLTKTMPARKIHILVGVQEYG
jgi:hypothetical protein